MDNHLTIKIVDNAFKHCQFHGQPVPIVNTAKHITWDWDVSDNEELVFYTDNNIYNIKPGHKKRVAWLIEPACKQLSNYQWISQNNKLFDYVLTHDHELLSLGQNFVFYPHCGCWIEEENRRTDHEKTKVVSIITSNKRNVPGHLLRHELITKHKDTIDVYGRGYTPIEPISLGLKDYMFHIAMENQQKDFYFTEKIMNPMLTGTVPLYFGMPSIDKFFDTRGMIIFNDINELDNILPSLNIDLYNSMKPYTEENFKLAHEYMLSEDWLYKIGFYQNL